MSASLGVASPLVVGGFEKLSTVDWPGRLAAVVFCQGCGWRCGYCHNPHLLPFARPAGLAPAPEWPEIARWLERRVGLLDAVVFSGGEATLQPGLGDAMTGARELGFDIGLHTGGPIPGRLANLLPLTDWVGFDFKAPFESYETVTLRRHGDRARESLRLLLAAGVGLEVRTTWHPRLLPEAALVRMAETLAGEGVDEWVIQRFRAEGCLDASLKAVDVGEPPLDAVRATGVRVTVR